MQRPDDVSIKYILNYPQTSILPIILRRTNVVIYLFVIVFSSINNVTYCAKQTIAITLNTTNVTTFWRTLCCYDCISLKETDSNFVTSIFLTFLMETFTTSVVLRNLLQIFQLDVSAVKLSKAFLDTSLNFLQHCIIYVDRHRLYVLLCGANLSAQD